MNMFGVLVATLLSLQQWAWDAVDRRLQGRDPLTALGRFAAYPARDDRYVFNPQFWGKGIDFSCVSPWNSCGGSLRAGTLISKRHIIFEKHFPIPTGSRIVFVGEDGGVCPCYVEKTKALRECDVMIGSLNAEVTPNILPAKILPPDFEKHIGEGRGFPIGTFNQTEKLFLTQANFLPTNGAPIRGITCRVPEDGNRARFREKIVVGDSGDPAFLLVGDHAILLYCLFGGRTGSGPAVHMFRREIQALMDELCPGYKLETFDFAALERK